MKLKEYLTKNRITRDEFAEIAGVAISTVSNYCSGRARPTFDISKRIEQATKGKVKMKDLWEDWRSRKEGCRRDRDCDTRGADPMVCSKAGKGGCMESSCKKKGVGAVAGKIPV